MKMAEILREETEKIKSEIMNNLPEEFLAKLEKGRANEVRNKIRLSVQAIFAWFGIGIELDITPIRVDSNDPEDERRKFDVQRTNASLQKIYQLPPELKKLPFELPVLTDEDLNPGEEEKNVKKVSKKSAT